MRFLAPTCRQAIGYSADSPCPTDGSRQSRQVGPMLQPASHCSGVLRRVKSSSTSRLMDSNIFSGSSRTKRHSLR